MVSKTEVNSNYNQNNGDDNEILWTQSCLIDRLKQHLATIERSMTANDREDCRKNRFSDPRKYYVQAHTMLITGALKPVPSFIIYLSDLSDKLIKELHELDRESRDYVLKQSIGRIFEDINFELYHNSISKVLKVKLKNG